MLKIKLTSLQKSNISLLPTSCPPAVQAIFRNFSFSNKLLYKIKSNNSCQEKKNDTEPLFFTFALFRNMFSFLSISLTLSFSLPASNVTNILWFWLFSFFFAEKLTCFFELNHRFRFNANFAIFLNIFLFISDSQELAMKNKPDLPLHTKCDKMSKKKNLKNRKFSQWQKLPEDIMREVLKQLDFEDRYEKIFWLF